MWEMLVLGTRLMTLSANISTGAFDQDAYTEKDTDHTMHQSDAAVDHNSLDAIPEIAEPPPQQIGGVTLFFTLLIPLGFAVAVFFLAPLFIAGLVNN